MCKCPFKVIISVKLDKLVTDENQHILALLALVRNVELLNTSTWILAVLELGPNEENQNPNT